jgi:hypothetical protein
VTNLVSVRSSGGEPNADSFLGGISANGKIIAFDTFASDMVGEKENHCLGTFGHCEYAFVRDETAGTTSLVSVAHRFNR